MFQRIPGHSFGKRASPLNFSRLPRLVCHAATSFLLVLVAHYVDDFPSVDVEAGGAMSSQDALRAILRAFGWDVELGKRKSGKRSTPFWPTYEHAETTRSCPPARHRPSQAGSDG